MQTLLFDSGVANEHKEGEGQENEGSHHIKSYSPASKIIERVLSFGRTEIDEVHFEPSHCQDKERTVNLFVVILILIIVEYSDH